MDDNQKLIEDFQRAFKFSRFEERKTFGVARSEAIEAACALHGGSILETFVICFTSFISWISSWMCTHKTSCHLP